MATNLGHPIAAASPAFSRPSEHASPLPELDVSHTLTEDEEGEEEEQSDSEEEMDTELIIENLTWIMESGFEFYGSFYTSRAYPNAPNPCLNLDGLGSVALPLATSAATTIIEFCGQAPFGKGNETVVDAKVRDTWEMGPSKVKFENTAWNQWINETVVPQVCEALGVDSSAGRVTTELYKLLLYEKGSHFLPHKDTEKAPGMFATFVVTLPSQFTGGSLHLQHAGESKVIDMSPDSAFSTQIAAWYTDVTHSVQPVLSGYRLVLSYNLIHAVAPSLRPDLTTTSPHAKELRRAFNAWKKNQSPQMVVYLFDHQYSSSNLLATALKGKDAHIIRNVRSIAEPFGFRIYLANIELYRRGMDTDYAGYDADEEPNDSWSASSLVDLQGNLMDIKKLNIKNEYVIPYSLAEEVPDKEKKEEYTGNAPGEVELWYHRTGLILWPEDLDLKNVKHELIEFASTHLSNSITTKPTNSEAALIQGLVDCLPKTKQISRKKTALLLVRRAAIRWRSPQIWLDAYEKGKVAMDVSLVGSRSLAEDLDVFGFAAVGNFLSRAIEHSRKDSDRFELLAQITHVAERNEDKALVQWVVDRRAQVCRSLHQPDKNLAPYLLAEVKQHGRSLLVDVILPQLENQLPPYEFWTPFLLGLYNENLKAKIPPNAAAVSEAITSVLWKVIPHAETFPQTNVPGTSWAPNEPEPNIGEWIGPITICLSTGHVPLVQEYFSRMLQDLRTMSDAMKAWTGTIFFPAAMREIDTLTFPPSLWDQYIKDTLALFWQMALKSYVGESLLLERRDRLNYYDPLFQEKGERLDGRLVLRALRGGANCDQLKTQLLIETNISHSREILLRNLALSLHNETRYPRKHDLPMVDPVKNLITEISIHLAKFATLSSRSPTDIPEKKEVMSLLDLILSVDSMQSSRSPKSLSIVLERLSRHQTTEYSFQDYMEQCLLPTLIRLLKEFKAGGITLPFEPASTFSAEVMEQYVHRIVGSDPNHMLPSATLQKFGENTVSFREAQRTRNHLENMLLNSRASNDGFRWSTSTIGIPYELQVFKSAEYIQKYGIEARRRKGIQLLNILGDPSVQKQVLGDKWPVICATLGLDVSSIIAHGSNQTQESVGGTSKGPQDPQNSRAVASASTANISSRKRAFEDVAGPSSGAMAFKKPKPSTDLLETIDISD